MGKTNLFASSSNLGLQLAVFDLETTGLSIDNDDIIEICIANITRGEASDIFHSLVATDKQLSTAQSLRAGGITNEELAKAPNLVGVLNHAYRKFAGKIWVAHNCHRFDGKMLMHAAPNLFGEFDFLDTLPLAQAVLPGLKRFANYKLDTITTLFGGHVYKEHEDQSMLRHRAKGDVMSLIPAINAMLRLLPNPTDVLPYIKKGRQLWGDNN